MKNTPSHYSVKQHICWFDQSHPLWHRSAHTGHGRNTHLKSKVTGCDVIHCLMQVSLSRKHGNSFPPLASQFANRRLMDWPRCAANVNLGSGIPTLKRAHNTHGAVPLRQNAVATPQSNQDAAKNSSKKFLMFIFFKLIIQSKKGLVATTTYSIHQYIQCILCKVSKSVSPRSYSNEWKNKRPFKKISSFQI